MEVIFTAKGYQPGAVRIRYVHANIKNGDYSWCEVGDDRRYDIRQGFVAAEELPDDIRAAADALRGDPLAELFTEQTGFDTHL